jgi:hypothetical protein
MRLRLLNNKFEITKDFDNIEGETYDENQFLRDAARSGLKIVYKDEAYEFIETIYDLDINTVVYVYMIIE